MARSKHGIWSAIGTYSTLGKVGLVGFVVFWVVMLQLNIVENILLFSDGREFLVMLGVFVLLAVFYWMIRRLKGEKSMRISAKGFPQGLWDGDALVISLWFVTFVLMSLQLI